MCGLAAARPSSSSSTEWRIPRPARPTGCYGGCAHMTARSAANANDFRWCFSFVARCVPLPGGWPGPLMGGGCRLRRRLAPRRQARSGSVRTLPEVGFTAPALSLLLKLACAPRAPSASAHAAVESAKRSGDFALLPTSPALARSRGLRWGKGLGDAPFPPRTHGTRSLTPSTRAVGSAARNDFVHTKSPGFSHSAKNDPPVAKALPTGGCCVATLFFE